MPNIMISYYIACSLTILCDRAPNDNANHAA